MGIARFRQLVSDLQVNINYTKGFKGFTPLLLVCFSNRSESLFICVDTLLGRPDININFRNKDECSALSLVAIFNGNNQKLPEIIRLFLQRGIDLNPMSSYGWDALSRSLLSLSFYHCNHPELVSIVRLLLEYGISFLKINSNDKMAKLRNLREKLIFLDLGFTNVETMIDLLKEYRIIVAIHYPIFSF